MTVSAHREATAGPPPGATDRAGRRPGVTGTLALLSRSVPWSWVLAVAVLSSLPAAVTLVILTGPPRSVTDWSMYLAPFGIASAVLLVRTHPVSAMIGLTVATGIGMPLASPVVEAGPAWAAGALIVVLWLGVCWVTYAVGMRCDYPWSFGLMAAFVAVTAAVPDDADEILLIVALGWWVVGLIVRSQQRLADQLISQAAELAAEQERSTTEAVRLERATIARELHDVVAHCMTVIVIQAQAARQLMDRDPAAATEAVDAIVASTHEAADDISALVSLITPDLAQPLTRPMLDDLATRAVAAGSVVEVDVVGELAELDPELAGATHRAVQEALTNVFRHAPGAPVRIAVATAPYRLVVTNGAPTVEVTLTRVGTGRGLTGLRDRLAAFGLATSYGPTADGGWELSVS